MAHQSVYIMAHVLIMLDGFPVNVKTHTWVCSIFHFPFYCNVYGDVRFNIKK